SRFRLSRVKKVNRLLEERVKVRTKQIAKERDEKAVLLQEIHHRVKNNLQIVNSLLRLQSHYVKDEEALWALDESQNRVMSMAMIHERMYKTENLANINIRDYITDLCRDIARTYDLSDSVELNLDIQVEKLNLDTLTPLGLIINEVTSNAMKYAFPDGKKGRFTVSLAKLQENRFKLTIGDDGIGIPIDLTDSAHDSLGTTLMESLSEQINGKLERIEGKGTMYQLIFEQIQT
ncbi:MAG: sensor histidine kinase, partial [Bacteroidetes bacterium]|nr:sensor histidine kinase [Bacteroidota bacterium]